MGAAKRRSTGGRKPARAAASATSRDVVIHTGSGDVRLDWPGTGDPRLGAIQRQAVEWSHVVRNRTRWARTRSAADQDLRAREFLSLLKVSEDGRSRLARAAGLTVAVPFVTEDEGWEARLVPWEFLLPAATRDLRTGPMVVSRWLLRPEAQRRFAFERVLFVESSPGRLGLEWSFDEEQRLVATSCGRMRFERLHSPTRAALAAKVASFRPDVVHLAGFDNHQGLALLGDAAGAGTTGAPTTARDGYLLAADTGFDAVAAHELVALLTAGGRLPHLVFCNFWNSASRVAALLVAAGVDAAIGFQDSIDDALAELFAASFYQGLSRSHDVAAAFAGAWQSLRAQPKSLRGSGIVLWRGGPAADLQQAVGHRSALPVALATEPHESTPSDKVADKFAITVEPEPLFSYGLLHNNRDLFRKFIIRNLTGKRLCDLEVFVELHSNDGTYPFRRSFVMNGPVLDLAPAIRIALTSQLARTLDEVLRTSIYVRISWGRHQVFSETFPVTLAPIDQWTDTDLDRVFLPSFVFPRDRAVSTIVKQAEHFVTALRDDPAAGFDGYQAIDAGRRNPAELVDRQVQALWYSIVCKVPASYINPPPTYAFMAQRIRTPSEVVSGGFGTCIDLALLLASGLEAVEIHPVVFLLQDHAFPGYWRTPEARERFCTRVTRSAAREGPAAPDEDGAAATRRAGSPWSFDATTLPEIVREVKANKLIPIETVNLATRTGIAEAIQIGRAYFDPGEQSRFLVMLDIQTAREQGVTPLPLGPRLQ